MIGCSLEDFMLAVSVADWLDRNKCVTQVIQHDDVLEVHYTLQLDVEPQPPIRIQNRKISIPSGSQESVVMALLRYLTIIK